MKNNNTLSTQISLWNSNTIAFSLIQRIKAHCCGKRIAKSNLTQTKIGQGKVNADARNSKENHWKVLICEKCVSIILSTGAKVGNSIKEKLGFVRSIGISYSTQQRVNALVAG
ncbi:hypothetical protein ACFLTE_06330 [Bacteroidota bacterium]